MGMSGETGQVLVTKGSSPGLSLILLLSRIALRSVRMSLKLYFFYKISEHEDDQEKSLLKSTEMIRKVEKRFATQKKKS